MLSLEYFAQSCFLIQSGSVKILIDPYDPRIGHKFPQRGADFVLVSHDHFDHDYVVGVAGRTTVVRGCAPRQLGTVRCHGVLAEHDEDGGHSLGHVTIFCLQTPQDMRLCHLSDLCHKLSAEQIQEIGRCDVLFLPVGGGGNSLDGPQAVMVAQQLKPKVIIPMHYRTPYLSRELFPHALPLEQFVKAARDVYPHQVRRETPLSLDKLPDTPTIWEMPHLY